MVPRVVRDAQLDFVASRAARRRRAKWSDRFLASRRAAVLRGTTRRLTMSSNNPGTEAQLFRSRPPRAEPRHRDGALALHRRWCLEALAISRRLTAHEDVQPPTRRRLPGARRSGGQRGSRQSGPCRRAWNRSSSSLRWSCRARARARSPIPADSPRARTPTHEENPETRPGRCSRRSRRSVPSESPFDREPVDRPPRRGRRTRVGLTQKVVCRPRGSRAVDRVPSKRDCCRSCPKIGAWSCPRNGVARPPR